MASRMHCPTFAAPSTGVAWSRWGCYATRSCVAVHRDVAIRVGVPRMSVSEKRVLVVGGTRFAGLYLVHALHAAGAGEVVVLNRGSKALDDGSLAVPGESIENFVERASKTKQLTADRTDAKALRSVLQNEKFDVIFDNNGREKSDSAPLADIAARMDAHFVYMSSAGVYAKSAIMPHIEGDAVDEKCRHKGKLDTEAYLRSLDLRWTAIRPSYIYGALNYNPLEQWFFERIDSGRPVCVPGHGMHVTGLGHVRDLAAAMTACALDERAYGQIFNVQDAVSITFDGVAQLCAKVAGKPMPEIVHYEPRNFKFGKKKAFPFRPQHFFCSPHKALRELEWSIGYDLERGFRDAYENDFLKKKVGGSLKNDFETDEMILAKVKGAATV